jgi:hypothetical protein
MRTVTRRVMRNSYEREIVAAEVREQSELEPGVQKSTGSQPVRTEIVI